MLLIYGQPSKHSRYSSLKLTKYFLPFLAFSFPATHFDSSADATSLCIACVAEESLYFSKKVGLLPVKTQIFGLVES